MGDPVDAQVAERVDLADQLVLDRLEVEADVQGRLRDEVDRAELERAERVLVVAATADHHHRRRSVRHHETQEREAVHARHLEVERDQVGLQLEGPAQRLLAVAGDADHFDERRGLEHPGDRLAREGGVVDDEDTDARETVHRSRSPRSKWSIAWRAARCQRSSRSSPGTGRRYTRSRERWRSSKSVVTLSSDSECPSSRYPPGWS